MQYIELSLACMIPDPFPSSAFGKGSATPDYGIVGCTKRSGRDKDVSFYRLPKITASKGSRVLELSKKRRAGYIAAISRGDLSEKILANDRICTRHFINGKPASLEDETNPDWLPTLNLGHSKVCERWSRRKAREDASNVALSTATATSSKDDAGEELHDHASSCFSSTEMNESCDEVEVVLMSHVMPVFKPATHHLAMSVFRLTCPLLW